MRTFVLIAVVLAVAGTATAQQPIQYQPYQQPYQYRAVSQQQQQQQVEPQAQAAPAAAGQQSYFNAGGCDGRVMGGCDGGCGVGCNNGCNNGCDGGCDSGCDGRGSRGGLLGGCGLLGGRGMGCGSGCCSPCCGVYHTFYGGFIVPHELSFETDPQTQTGVPTEFDMELEDGWLAGHGVGRQLSCCWRAEIDTTYRDQSTSDVEVVGAQPIDTPGRLKILSGCLNLIRDLNPRGACCQYKPYVGVGAGVAFIDLEGTAPAVGGTFDSRDSTFAYQAFFGVAKKVRPCADLYAEYRAFGTDDFCVDLAAQGLDFGSEATYFSHNFIFGARIWTR